MTEWPRIMTDVDNDRPATDEEVGYCDKCGSAVLEGELKLHLNEWRCDECRTHCHDEMDE